MERAGPPTASVLPAVLVVTARRFYMDMDPRDRVGIQRGDLLIGPNVTKLVLDAWPTESRTATNRWTLTVQPLGRRRSTGIHAHTQ